MAIKLITGNKRKLGEFNQILGPNISVEQLEIDLDEIQGLDPKKILEHKLNEASKHHKGEMLVEDTSVFLEALEWKFPGPLIKWLWAAIGANGTYKLAENSGKTGAKAVVSIGYYDGKECHYFEGTIEGDIVSPRGESDFEWDVIFRPKGEKRAYSQMSKEEKHKISARGKALEKFREYYLSKTNRK